MNDYITKKKKYTTDYHEGKKKKKKELHEKLKKLAEEASKLHPEYKKEKTWITKKDKREEAIKKAATKNTRYKGGLMVKPKAAKRGY